jgi:hypothetical protein
MVRRLSEPPSRSGDGEDRHVCVSRESNLDLSAPSLVTILSDLRVVNALMLKAASTFETSANFCQNARGTPHKKVIHYKI